MDINSSDIPQQELDTIAFWKKHGVYQKSLENRKDAPLFVFYEGPPTANGLPHPGHCLTRAIKDLYPRYKTMRGFLCNRKAGWDTHGLPVEVEVCKELGIHSKDEIEKYGVEPFIIKCYESVFRYTKQWEYMTERLGFWINLEEAYITYKKSYVESVWAILKNFFDRKLLYKGNKIVWWWPQGGTALSSGEVGQGYRQVADPSVFVRFSPRTEFAALPPDTDLLVWTTTPWTLPSNQFAAVNPNLTYAVVSFAGERNVIVAAELVDSIAAKIKKEAVVLQTLPGKELVGLQYNPPFDFYYNSRPKEFSWHVVAADFVTTDSGTGLVHQAPAFGEVDFDVLLAEQAKYAAGEGPQLLCSVAPNGTFTEETPEFQGRYVKEADKDICRYLKERGLLFLQEQYLHEYPFCWRAENDPLIQYPRKSWFLRTTAFKDAMLANNAEINWLPEHIKNGRFGNFLESNVDWALSRERYWGTPLPIWVCEESGEMESIGSYAELLAKPGVSGEEIWLKAKAENPELLDDLCVHKPYIDAVTYDSPFAAGKKMRRVNEVIDCWFDSGAMPFAQWGYPHEKGSAEALKSNFPADFISEAIDQTRGWFYSLLAISTLLNSPGNAGILPACEETDVPSKCLHNRGYLPHWEAGKSPQHVTFRLADSLPNEVLQKILNDIKRIPEDRQDAAKRMQVEELLDKHYGECWMKRHDVAKIVQDAILFFKDEKYVLHAWVVMPNHVHVLFTPQDNHTLSDILHSWKSFSAKKANKLLGRTGAFWQIEHFDRMIRNDEHFFSTFEYIENNPVKANLVEKSEDWLFGSAKHRVLQGESLQNPTQARCLRSQGAPFKNCIVLGLMLGEDGQKMSKSKRNYREPTEIFDKYGADALRWYLFANQTPWTTIRYSEQAIKDSMPEFIIRLANVVSFYDVYRKIDGFNPGNAGILPASGETELQAICLRSQNELDRWILSELHTTIRDVTTSMDAFDHFSACGKLNAFVDSLSNWYVRRSRDRFWSSVETDCTKQDAYETLYECLKTTAKLIAPFVPFLAERIWQNVAPGNAGILPASEETDLQARCLRSQGRAESPLSLEESVHLCDYPVADTALIDETLSKRMRIVREIVSLGRNARMNAKLKVRQPLSRVEVVLADTSELDWLQKQVELIEEELNVKSVEFIDKADQYITYSVLPDFKKLGPKLGKMLPDVKKALAEADGAALLAEMERNGCVTINLSKAETAVLQKDEIQIRLQAKDGWAAAQGAGCVVVLSTELTPELLAEGRAREIIRQIQDKRKEIGCEYTDRIKVVLKSSDSEQRNAAIQFKDVISKETLCDSFDVLEASEDTISVDQLPKTSPTATG